MILTLSACNIVSYPHSISHSYFRFASGWVALVQPWLFTEKGQWFIPLTPDSLFRNYPCRESRTWTRLGITVFDSKCTTKKIIRHCRGILFWYFGEGNKGTNVAEGILLGKILVYTYICVCVCVCRYIYVYIYIYIYIYRERERERESAFLE